MHSRVGILAVVATLALGCKRDHATAERRAAAAVSALPNAPTVVAADASTSVTGSVEPDGPVELATSEWNAGHLTVQDEFLYWSVPMAATDNPTRGALMRVKKAGGPPAVLVAAPEVVGGFVVHNEQLIWTGRGGSLSSLDLSRSANGIVRLVPPFPGMLLGDDAVVVDRSIVWSATGRGPGEFLMVPAAGGQSTRLLSNAFPSSVAADDTSIYWTDITDRSVRRYVVSTGAASVLATKEGEPSSIAVHGDHVYWADTKGGRIVRVRKAGGSSEVLAANQREPHGVAVDDTSVYWTNRQGGTVMRVSTEGGAPIEVASGLPTPNGIVADDRFIYWVNHGKTPGIDHSPSTIMRLRKR